jgi:hypothetical protein
LLRMVAITPQEIETLKSMAEAGASCQRIAVRLKRPAATIRSTANKHGIKLKTKTELRKSFGLSPFWSNRTEQSVQRLRK